MHYNQMLLLEELKNHLWAEEELKLIFLVGDKISLGNFIGKNENGDVFYYLYKFNMYEKNFKSINFLDENYHAIIENFIKEIEEKYTEGIPLKEYFTGTKEEIFKELVEILQEETKDKTVLDELALPAVIYNYQEVETSVESNFYDISSQTVSPLAFIRDIEDTVYPV